MEQTQNNQKEGGVYPDAIADQLAVIIAKLDSLIALKNDIAEIKEAWLERRTNAIKEAEDKNQDPVTDLGMEEIPSDISMPGATPITTAQTKSQSLLISDLEKKMLEAADETDDQASLEEAEHENHGETKNAELDQKLFSRDAVLKSLCDYSYKDHTKTQTDKKQLEWSFQKAIKGWMDDKVDWPAKLTDINTDL
ncbi:hypothetical protein HanPI659440_Chr11g0413621 [Helianthus annuus]|nr:hypothetical protein HanPI659440_Chr11g0413621 [Helianthus annuus]